ncbi:uncharacterized protein LOC126637134 isoform X1 [Myiozetetes cayanensis]|uniref:uncharacterized protein LOC126637134 isoform X1 n=1 Tax=Myiozetetes cayanensis TaxID=478635 RepID=UPI0021606755|nr:uncharacterized protein LOC126637134 isoform X1 [Myiozetetes cayanensis]
MTCGVSVHSSIVPSLGEGEVRDSAGNGGGILSRLANISSSLSPRVGARWHVGLSNSQEEAELTRADRRIQVPPSSTLLPQFFLFLAPSFRLSPVRRAFRSAPLPQKGSGGGTTSFVPHVLLPFVLLETVRSHLQRLRHRPWGVSLHPLPGAVVTQPSLSVSQPSTSQTEEKASELPKPKRNRCFTCRKKVGLTGFDCRCGNLFCGLHRYSDKHNCPYDYKTEAAAKIRKENPVVVAEKIQRI